MSMGKFADHLQHEFLKAAVSEAANLKSQAEQDVKNFLKSSANEIAQWTHLYKTNKMTKLEYESLMRGQTDLAEMHALLQAGLAAAAAERLRKKLIDLSIDLALKILL